MDCHAHEQEQFNYSSKRKDGQFGEETKGNALLVVSIISLKWKARSSVESDDWGAMSKNLEEKRTL